MPATGTHSDAAARPWGLRKAAAIHDGTTMRLLLLAIVLPVSLASQEGRSDASRQSGVRFDPTTDANASQFAGRWEAGVPNVPRPFSVDLKIEGGRVMGVWNPNRLEISDGVAVGDTLRFKVKSPDGARTVTFTGTHRGDALLFVRDVEAPPDRAAGQGIFGVAGVPSFTATRAP